MASPTSPATTSLPSRATTNMSSLSEDVIPDIDPTSTAGLLAERLQAWKHAVAYLEEYVEATEKIHGRHAKEYEKVLKTISNPLREGHHFDQSLGGVAGFFENMRSNTQALINTNLETEKNLKGSVLPVLDRLHKEIKHKAKELASGAQKGAKEVEKNRNTTQKHIELLGQHAASFDSAGGKFSGADDPYIIHRGVLHRLSNQVISENNHRNDLISVQSNFQAFEAHVIEVLQQVMEAFVQLTGGQGDKTRALYGDMLGTAQQITHDFEWNSFSTRSADRLVNPNDPPRSVEAVHFPNMEHPSMKPLIEGSLERKSRNKLSWGYSTGYYVVTAAKFLHEFKDSDNIREDPKPELSIYLPEATIGSPSGEKFNVKGKDKAKTLSSKLTGSTELAFKAHTAADAQKWHQIISNLIGTGAPAVSPVASVVTTPVTESTPTFASMDAKPPIASPIEETKGQESGVTGEKSAVPATTPAAAAAIAGSDEKKPAA